MLGRFEKWKGDQQNENSSAPNILWRRDNRIKGASGFPPQIAEKEYIGILQGTCLFFSSYSWYLVYLLGLTRKRFCVSLDMRSSITI
jgi:hypothetical protein